MAITMHGLNLDFLKSPASKKHLAQCNAERRKKAFSRYEDYRDRKASDLPAPMVMPDINAAYGDGFVSPVDRSFISSRSQLRAHNRKHRVDQCGDVSLDAYTRHVEQKHDVGPINPNEVSFEWSDYKS